MSFINLFRSKSTNKKVINFGDYSIGRPFRKKSKFSNQIKVGIFHLTDQGPMVMYKDFDELRGVCLSKTELSKKIDTLAVNLIAATGSGHSYIEGCFDFKFETINSYRLLVIAITMPKTPTTNQRANNGYYQVVLFIPQNLTLNLPSISKMEDDLFKLVGREIKSHTDFTDSKIQKLKKLLGKKLESYQIKY